MIEDHVRAVLADLLPGAHRAHSLYRRYQDWAKAHDVQPGHRVAMGQVLRDLGATQVRRDGDRCWVIPPRLTIAP